MRERERITLFPFNYNANCANLLDDDMQIMNLNYDDNTHRYFQHTHTCATRTSEMGISNWVFRMSSVIHTHTHSAQPCDVHKRECF